MGRASLRSTLTAAVYVRDVPSRPNGTYMTLTEQPGTYDFVVRDKPLRTLVLVQLLGRSPVATMTLALIVFVDQTHDDIALAGMVVAAYTLGAGVAGPVSSGLVARLESRSVLTILTLLWTALLVSLAVLAPADPVTLCLLATAIGLLLPPVGPVVRSIYPHIVPRDRVANLIALDSSLVETMWIFGPVIVACAQHFLGVRAALVVVAGIALLGVSLMVSNSAFRSGSEPAEQTSGTLSVLRDARLWPLLVAVTGLMGGWGAVEIALVARFPNPLVIGGLFAAMSCAGFAAGILWGRRAVGGASIATRSCLMLGGLALALVNLGPWWLVLILPIVSIGSPPTMSAIILRATHVASGVRAAVVFGWLATAQLAGTAIGAYASGHVIQRAGDWRAGIATACAMVAVTSVAGLVVLNQVRREDVARSSAA